LVRDPFPIFRSQPGHLTQYQPHPTSRPRRCCWNRPLALPSAQAALTAKGQTANALTTGLPIAVCRTCNARSRSTAHIWRSRSQHIQVSQPRSPAQAS
jgi:hypothetical protein